MEPKIEITPGKNNKIASYILSLRGIKVFYALLGTLIIFMIPVLFAIYDGNFRNPALKADIVSDYANLLFYLVGVPTMLLSAILYANKFPQVLEQLKNNEVIHTNSEEWIKFKIKANNIYSNWYYTSGPHIIALAITIALFFVFRKPLNPIWYSLETDNFIYLGGWAQLIVYYITFYIFSLSLLNIFSSYRILKVLFSSNKIIVQPLHPDKCGGLAPLGALSRTLIYANVFLGIIVALNIYHNYVDFGRGLDNPLQISIILGYLVCTYIIFFLPMHAAHKPMKKAKEDEMKLIHHYIAKINKEVKKDLEEFKDIDNNALENFQHAKEIYDITSEMPVYPYNVKTVLTFISSVMIPIAYYVFERIASSF